MPAVLWFRRDLRIGDNAALLAAADAAPDGVLALFILDEVLLGPAGDPRKDYLYDALRSLNASLGGRLVIRTGVPAQVVPAVAAEIDAATVHIAADFGPYGSVRDLGVEAALTASGRQLIRTGSPYAVAPGRVTKADGTPYKVFTPFFKAWINHGWRAPAAAVGPIPWILAPGDPVPAGSGCVSPLLPGATEAEALQRLEAVAGLPYMQTRDLPGIDGTTMLSGALRWGLIHPRTILARLGPEDEGLRKELCWREFYANVLHHHPLSARESMSLRSMQWDEPGESFSAWREGRTGYPIVDAGMRQLLATGWMHNRVRMITASFLVKDLHLDWRLGARHFMRHLIDGDLASNQHGWQWTAGTGTDAAPFFRIFNPVAQGKRFDPDGAYVRTYIPELAAVESRWIHEPWLDPLGPPLGYPAPIVEHSVERAVALERLTRAQ